MFYDYRACPLEALRELYSREQLIIEKRTKRGSAEVDILPLTGGIEIEPGEDGQLLMRSRLSAQDPALSPAQLISAIDQLAPELSPDFTAFRRVEVRDSDLHPFR